MARPVDPARVQALDEGATRYLSDRPCPHGHTGWRFSTSSGCCTCQDQARAKRLGIPYVASDWTPEKAKTKKMRAEPPKHPATPIKSIKMRKAALVGALSAYHNSNEARERSRHLDHLLKTRVSHD